MYRNVLFMLAAAVSAAAMLFALGLLSYGWAYGESTFGGHLGFILPILIGAGLFMAGVLYERADATFNDEFDGQGLVHGTCAHGVEHQRV